VEKRNLASTVREQLVFAHRLTTCVGKQVDFVHHVDPKIVDSPPIFGINRGDKRVRFEFESLQGHLVKALIR